jgi:8-oxo-dGTP pyrophosphatase MutT (NUDIX family)
MRPLVSDEEVRTLCLKGHGPGRAWALRAAEERGIKDFSAGSPLASGFVPFDLEPGVQSVVPGLKKPKKKPKKDKAQSAADVATPGVVAAGLAVRAEDTGRVLVLQRARDESDPASGQIEFGGGRLEPGETPFAAACREWSEEVGCPCPTGQIVGMWESSDGKYQGFVLSIPHESAVAINLDYPRVENPDAPLHAKPETAMWMDISDLHTMGALRTELQRDLPRVLPSLRAPVRSTKAADDPAPRMAGSSIDESDVMKYLQKHYPDADLGWVSRCLWSKDNVLLKDVNWQDRPGGIDEEKVDEMAGKLAEGWMPHEVVLVAPDADSKMEVADGYHRCAGNAKEKIGVVRAWVGTPKPGNDGWQADVRAMQFTAKNRPPGLQGQE